MNHSFIHLNIHSEFSVVDSTLRIKQIVAAAKENNTPAVGITDFNNMFAAVKFYKAALSAGIKPILGAEVLILDESEMVYSVTFLCMNNEGYLNLSELISKAHQQGYYKNRPMLREAWIEEYHSGLIAISCNQRGDIGQMILQKKVEEASDKIQWWKNIFSDRYYMSMARVGREHENWHNDVTLYLASHLNVALVASNDARFLKAQDFNAHEARVCINQGQIVADSRRDKLYTRKQFLTTPEEMCEKFNDLPQLLDNTLEIAKRCNFSFKFGDYYLPEFPIPKQETEDQYFRRITKELLKEYLEKFGPSEGYTEEDYYNRLVFEVDIILEMGFPGYFLIVADFINWSKNNEIPVGPGRGSGAGSLVAFVLKITDLDPLRYELLFERFLNPERISMPDFDVDFCMDRRDEVIEYVTQTYGANQVSQIITFGTMSAKAVVRDVGRVLGYPYPMVDGIAKLIPNDLGITLTKALDESHELRLLKETDEGAGEVLDMAIQLEGLTRNTGKHAGGVVIAPSKLSDFCPVYKDNHSEGILSQYDKDDVETIGLVKFDFLGLRTLTIIDNAVQAINATYENKVDISQIPLDDSKAFELLKKCQTTAVFQLESSGMKALIKRLVPDSFAEIIALVALYRPGPLDSGMVDTYVECKHGRQEPDYLHPDIEEILKPTYGVILYQEQVMKIAQTLSGYTLGAADILRKAMGKKIVEVMEKQRQIFVDGAVANNVDGDLARHIFSLIETFAGYGFNKSHSAAYALVSYQTAWLKAHYPVEFMASVLSADMDNTDKVVHLIDDVYSMNIKVNVPAINESDYHFKASEDKSSIIYGLGAIKGVGQGAVENIMQERRENGVFTSIYDFCVRVDLHKVNKRTLEALVLSGAFDSVHSNRQALMQGMEGVIKAALQKNQDQESGQFDLFGATETVTKNEMPVPLPDISDYADDEKLFHERDMLGHFMSGHPVALVRRWLNVATRQSISSVLSKRPPDNTEQAVDGKPKYNKGTPVIVAGLISSVRIRNENSASVVLVDENADIEVSFFKESFYDNEAKMLKDTVVVITGDAGLDNFSGRFIIRGKQILTLDEAIATYCTKIGFMTSTQDYVEFSRQVQHLIQVHGRGKARIYIHHNHEGVITNLKLGDDFKIRPSFHLIQEASRHNIIDSIILR